jgi:hypothetical protein
MPIPADQIPVGEGLLPNGTTAPFFVDKKELDTVRDHGPTWKYYDARFLEEAVAKPDAIFEGLRRPNQGESFCYSVQPTRDPDDQDDPYNIGLPPVFGQVFLAFVTLGAMGYVVFDWEWRPVSPDDPGHPENWQKDFVRRVWP